MKKHLLPFVIFLNMVVFLPTTRAQIMHWGVSVHSSANLVTRSMVSDPQGNTYIVGTFSGTVDFDPGPATVTISSSVYITFVLKLDPSGDFVWVKTCGGLPVCSPKLDSNGNLYIGGVFTGNIDLDPGPGTAAFTSIGVEDCYILKLDASGNFLWAKKFGSTNTIVETNSIFVDGSDNIFVTGVFDHTVDFDPGPGTSNLTSTSSGYYNVYVLKLDAAGNFVWVKQLKGSGSIAPASIVVDGVGDIYSLGQFTGIIDFDPGTGTNTLTGSPSVDMYVCKLDPFGNYIWAGTIGSDVTAYGMALDGNGALCITGLFYGIGFDFDPGPGTAIKTSKGQEVFVLKLNLQGDFVWVKTFGALATDGYCFGRSICVDASSNILITGSLRTAGNVDLDPGPATVTFQANFNYDQTYVLKLNASGDYLWSHVLGGNDHNMGTIIGLDKNANILGSGSYRGTIDVDPGTQEKKLTSVSPQTMDNYFFKWCDIGTGYPELVGCNEGDVGIGELPGNKIALKMYPNPANRELNIEFELNQTSELTIELYDVIGKMTKVILPKSVQPAGTKNMLIATEALEPGVYFVKCRVGKEESVTKLIVNR